MDNNNIETVELIELIDIISKKFGFDKSSLTDEDVMCAWVDEEENTLILSESKGQFDLVLSDGEGIGFQIPANNRGTLGKILRLLLKEKQLCEIC
jgi:hypothetical protein